MADRLELLRRELEAVRVEFERFFMGLEKRPPYRRRDQAARQIRRFIAGNNAVQRFKHQNLIQRLVTLEQYWGRIQRGIDAGTLSREVARADFRTAHRKNDPNPAKVGAASADRTSEQKEAVAKEIANTASDFLSELKDAGPKIPAQVAMRGRGRDRGKSSS